MIVTNHMLRLAIENGIIDMNTIRYEVEMREKQKYLDMHNLKVWIDKDGKYNTYLPPSRLHGRRLLRKKDKDEFEQEIINFYKALETQPYITDVFNMWIDEKLEYGEILKQSYDRYKNQFKKYIEESELSKIKMCEITEPDLERFIKKTIHEHNLSSKQWSDLRILINGIFKYAKKTGNTDISITYFMGDLELSKNCFRKTIRADADEVFTDAEIDKITSYIYSHITQVTLGILFALQSGLRCGELSALKSQDLNGNVLTVNKTEVHYRDSNNQYVYEVRGYTKGREGHREVILPESAVKLFKQIRMMNPFSEYLFENDGNRIRGKTFTNRLYGICEKVGIPKRSLHKCRKTYATKLLNAGVNDNIIIHQMGHTSIDTTKSHYYFNNFERKEIERIIADVL